MGQKGTGVNVTDVAATFMALTSLIAKIETDCGTIIASKMHMQNEIANGEMDAETKDSVSQTLDNITSIMATVQSQAGIIKTQVNKLLETANAIQSRSRSAQSATAERAKTTGQKLGKR